MMIGEIPAIISSIMVEVMPMTASTANSCLLNFFSFIMFLFMLIYIIT